MSDQIHLSPQQLRDEGSSFISYSGEIGGIVSKLAQMKDRLMGEWQGSSSQAFGAQFDQLKPNMDKFVELIDKVGHQLQNIATTIEQTDQDIAKQVGQF